jgi:hypothetical protein
MAERTSTAERHATVVVAERHSMAERDAVVEVP